jgi:hypothetical protein
MGLRRSGSCGPCYLSDDLFDAWSLYFALKDNNGKIWGTLFEVLNLKLDTGNNNNNGGCNDGSECCKWNPDCGGGIGCQVVGITTPENCDCPPNTTYAGYDAIYKVKQCTCNECK